MRKIDIRAWDKTKKEYWYNVLSDMGEVDMYDDEYSMWNVGYDMETGEDEKLVFEQYTGVNDSKGTKIYEHDIVSISGFEKQGVFIKGIVKWSEERTRFSIFTNGVEQPNPPQYRQVSYEYKLYKDTSERIEVIGNIHEGVEECD